MKERQSNVNVALNLNEQLAKCAVDLLEEHAVMNPQSKFDIVCDLPKLCRDLCLIILHYLWIHLCKGYKTKTARICCISDDTVRNYEKFVEP